MTTGKYVATVKGRNFGPVEAKGYWSVIREGDDWKIRVAAWYIHPDSVFLINKSFARQPAPTPSPTAEP